MKESDSMTEPRQTSAEDQKVPLLYYCVAGGKAVFVLAVFRVLAGPFTEDVFGEELLPMPTWEWVVFSVTPLIILWLARRPVDWEALSGERMFFRIALTFYLLYALTFSLFQGEWILLVGVAAGLSGLSGIYYLNHRESSDAD
ncbi:hypothetical protein ACFWJE_16075 [Streptomyces griseoincarnatus]|uniref:hypothetical protein n=1 Tax=Streptomyces sp. OS603R TaxID=3035287 RepID=UPI002435D235|nr:hypothetical protein [Streptomyces sp. OS603R]